MQINRTPKTVETEELRLHDDTIQRLFAISLKVEYCLAVLDATPDQAKAGLDHVVTDLDGLISGLRERIYLLK